MIANHNQPHGSAAQRRRAKENAEYAKLASLLPTPAAITSRLDKSAVVRLVAAYLNLKNWFWASNFLSIS